MSEARVDDEPITNAERRALRGGRGESWRVLHRLYIYIYISRVAEPRSYAAVGCVQLCLVICVYCFEHLGPWLQVALHCDPESSKSCPADKQAPADTAHRCKRESKSCLAKRKNTTPAFHL